MISKLQFLTKKYQILFSCKFFPIFPIGSGSETLVNRYEWIHKVIIISCSVSRMIHNIRYYGDCGVVLWIGIVFMPIRIWIRRSMLLPVQFRIRSLPQVFSHVGKSEKHFWFLFTAVLVHTVLIFLVIIFNILNIY